MSVKKRIMRRPTISGLLVTNATMVLHSEEVALYYQWFLDVEVMIFLGFGFLMTFLRRYSYSAVAFNFFISAFVMVYSVLVIGAVQQVSRAGRSSRQASSLMLHSLMASLGAPWELMPLQRLS